MNLAAADAKTPAWIAQFLLYLLVKHPVSSLSTPVTTLVDLVVKPSVARRHYRGRRLRASFRVGAMTELFFC